MSTFFQVYFVKTQASEQALKEYFGSIQPLPDSQWLRCGFKRDYSKGIFEEEGYLTPRYSTELGEVIFICADTSADQFDYEHSLDGDVLRKLCWCSDGNQSLWLRAEGAPESWEDQVVFSPQNHERTLEQLQYRLEYAEISEQEFAEKSASLEGLWQRREYVLEEQLPMGDAEFAYGILRALGLSLA